MTLLVELDELNHVLGLVQAEGLGLGLAVGQVDVMGDGPTGEGRRRDVVEVDGEVEHEQFLFGDLSAVTQVLDGCNPGNAGNAGVRGAVLGARQKVVELVSGEAEAVAVEVGIDEVVERFLGGVHGLVLVGVAGGVLRGVLVVRVVVSRLGRVALGGALGRVALSVRQSRRCCRLIGSFL